MHISTTDIVQLLKPAQSTPHVLVSHPHPHRHTRPHGIPQDIVLLLDALDEADPLDQQLAALAETGGGGSDTAAGNSSGSGDDGGGGGGGGPRPCPLVCGNRALQLVSAHLVRLPPYVRFVFTTRPDAAGGQVGAAGGCGGWGGVGGGL